MTFFDLVKKFTSGEIKKPFGISIESDSVYLDWLGCSPDNVGEADKFWDGVHERIYEIGRLDDCMTSPTEALESILDGLGILHRRDDGAL